MPYLDPPEPLPGHTRLPFRANAALVLVLTGCFVAGGVMLAVGLRWIELSALGNGPRWTLAVFGAAALSIGLLLGARFLESLALRRSALNAPPGWPTDYPWPRDRVLTDDRPRVLAFDALGILALLSVLALLNTPAFVEPDIVPVVAWVAMAGLDLLAVAGLVGLGRRWLFRAGHGAVALTVDGLPVAPGQTLRGVLRLPVGGPAAELELRGVRETAKWLRHGDSHSIKIKTTAFYRERLPAPSADGRIAVAIPPDAPSTQLAEPPVVYWELVTRIRGGEMAVLLPVYSEVKEMPNHSLQRTALTGRR